jgi:hypothetical protein
MTFRIFGVRELKKISYRGKTPLAAVVGKEVDMSKMLGVEHVRGTLV